MTSWIRPFGLGMVTAGALLLGVQQADKHFNTRAAASGPHRLVIDREDVGLVVMADGSGVVLWRGGATWVPASAVPKKFKEAK